MAQTKGILERVFKLSEKGTTVKTEILAGLTTFVAMAYIIFVNPSILADAGIPKEAAIAATVWSAVIGSAAMGLWANFPVAVAPGMGLNAFFAYYVCGVLGLHWTVALGAVFFSGIVFLLLTVTHVRQLLIDAVPMNLKYAIVVGIGMFIAFIGLQNAGIVVKNDATVVALGHVTQPGPLLACCGLMLTAGLMARNVQGSLLIGILVTAVLGMVFGVSPAPSGIDSVMSFSLPSLAPTLMQLDIMGALKYGIISIIFTFTIVELFDNMGTLISLYGSGTGNMLNYLPALTRQYTYMLANLNPYQVNVEGEIGGQIDLNYSLRNKRDRHRYWNFHANVSTFYTLRGEQSQTGDRQLLWRDINVDVERQWNKKLKTSLLFSCQEWNPDHGFSSRTYASNIFVGDVTYKFDRKKSLRAEVQYLFSQDYEGNWVAGLLEFGLAPKWSFFVSDMYNQGGTKGETNKNYYNGGFSYTHNRTRVQISYGRNRAGYICSGGVCRYSPAYTGCNIAITSSF